MYEIVREFSVFVFSVTFLYHYKVSFLKHGELIAFARKFCRELLNTTWFPNIEVIFLKRINTFKFVKCNV